MAGGVNKAILVGNLGADPEVRYTASGTAVANFRIATSESFTNRDGQKETRTEWHRIVTFGKLAEICGEYLSKGRQVYIEGRIQTREWEDRDGNKKYTTEIVANQMQMLGGRGDGGGQGGGGGGYGGGGRGGGGQGGGGQGGGGGGGQGGGYGGPDDIPPSDIDDVPF